MNWLLVYSKVIGPWTLARNFLMLANGIIGQCVQEDQAYQSGQGRVDLAFRYEYLKNYFSFS